MKLNEIAEEYIRIKVWLNRHDIIKYTINPDYTVDVEESVNISNRGLTSIPIQFGDVGGDFVCFHNNLTSLTGAPKTVGGYFICFNNHLTSLTGAPKTVGKSFICSHNNLYTLHGAPKSVSGNFDCEKQTHGEKFERSDLHCNLKGEFIS